MFAFATFIGSLVRNPTKVGSLAPSSSALSRRLASLVPGDAACVVEVGAGTGSVTRALLERGIPGERLWVLELDPQLASFLRQEFPQARVLCGDARELSQLLPKDVMGKVDCVVSGLPLRSLGENIRREVIRSSFAALRPGGALLQFTYGLRSPITSVKETKITRERIGRVWTNFPPATVWRYRKSTHESLSSVTVADRKVV